MSDDSAQQESSPINETNLQNDHSAQAAGERRSERGLFVRSVPLSFLISPDEVPDGPPVRPIPIGLTFSTTTANLFRPIITTVKGGQPFRIDVQVAPMFNIEEDALAIKYTSDSEKLPVDDPDPTIQTDNTNAPLFSHHVDTTQVGKPVTLTINVRNPKVSGDSGLTKSICVMP